MNESVTTLLFKGDNYMFTSTALLTLMLIFIITLIIASVSGLIFINKRVPLSYIHIHLILGTLPIIVSFIALVQTRQSVFMGPFHFDILAWLMAFFVLIIGLIIQRFSMQYLKGDFNYRKYFVLFQAVTSFASIAWLSDDLRLMTLFWGLTLVCLTLLMRLNRRWKVTKAAAKVTDRYFFLGWLALAIAVMWCFFITGEWKFSTVLTASHLSSINGWEYFGLSMLIILAVIVPAAQWPFQRWLIESVAAPTPVSAIMHAGIVNAGGVMLTRFSPLFTSDVATIILIIIACISVLIGSGISLVHVDYKRQLVGSTMGQMGFMLIQCALGAYIAAIIHLILHGLFKATLFLRSGSAVQHFDVPARARERLSYIWILIGRLLACVLAVIFWWTSPEQGYGIISALILAWSLSVSWTQLVAFGEGVIGRLIGLGALVIIGIVYLAVHHYFYQWLMGITMHQNHPSIVVFIAVAVILVLGSIASTWVARHRSSKIFAKIYLWLVHVGDAKTQAIERHPNYLKKFLS